MSQCWRRIETVADSGVIVTPHFSSLYVSLQLEPGCFKPISRIRTLIMDGSKTGTLIIAKLCSQLSGTAIDVLSLRNMRLVTLTNTTFTGLQETNLTSLDLSGNGMGKIEKGSFKWLSELQSLVLAENNIKHLTKDIFQGLTSLKRLNLTLALVKSHTSAVPIIDDYSFQPLNALETLILKKTAVREITENAFTGLTSLKELDMSWTTYTDLKNITNKTFVSLARSPLRKLNLIGADVKQINPGCFSVFRNQIGRAHV